MQEIVGLIHIWRVTESCINEERNEDSANLILNRMKFLQYRSECFDMVSHLATRWQVVT